MTLFKIAALSSLLVLAACSSSENTTLGETTTPVPSLGSITISTEPAPMINPLPEIEFVATPSGNDGGSEELDRLPDSVSATMPATDSEFAGSTAGAGTTGGDTGGGDTGGFSTAGSDPSEFAADGGDMFVGAPGIPVEGDSTTGGAPVPISIPPTEDDDVVQQQVRSGLLTAGDYDDQLNPHLYQDYAAEYLQRAGNRVDVPYLDLSNRIALHVSDEQGRAYADAAISITGDNNQILDLTTPATGITYIYRDLDSIPEQFTIRATGIWGTAIDATIDLAQVQSNRIDIVVPENSAPADATQQADSLDIMFVIDTTGSMGDELSYIQTELRSIINGLPFDNGEINLGLTFYRDIGDDYVVRSHGFNNDIDSVQQTLSTETYGGGGDYPEAMDQALHQAVDANWSQSSDKVLFLIADAPPHNNKMRATWDAAAQARIKGIHIVPVAASGVAEEAEYIMRSMAAFTNSRYVFLTDDSGIGNSHAEPDVDCYIVTQLNNLMIRVLNSLLAGKRQEPTDNEIIRRVGNYDNGVCQQQ